MADFSKYEPVIGLEVHVELNTKTKAFCACKTDFGAFPNTQVCPVCLGHPGALPTFNRAVLEKAIAIGTALNCKIHNYSAFDRKNYFYPDLPKAYQITQFFKPICTDGFLTVNGRKIGINRLHIEEDAGKLIHEDGTTKIDYNRSGVPLAEIVSEPEIRCAEEAKEYLKILRSNILFLHASDCKMNEGSMRCDVNISVRKIGEKISGDRCEIKNLNSFKNVARAIECEFLRQVEIIESGKRVERATLKFDAGNSSLYVMRSKESAPDYRYFPEPDLPTLFVSDKEIKKIQSNLPKLPWEIQNIFLQKFNIPLSVGIILTDTPEKADFFFKSASLSKYPVTVANIINTDIAAFISGADFYSNISPENLAVLCDLFGDGEINSATLKALLKRFWEQETNESPISVVDAENLRMLNDKNALEKIALDAINQCEKAVSDYKKGKKTAASSIIGKAMGLSRGRANPNTLKDIIMMLLEKTE